MTNRQLVILAVFAAVVLGTQPAVATVDCSANCPDGQVLIGFGDGDDASCECVAQSTVTDEVVPYVSEGDESPNADVTDN